MCHARFYTFLWSLQVGRPDSAFPGIRVIFYLTTLEPPDQPACLPRFSLDTLISCAGQINKQHLWLGWQLYAHKTITDGQRRHSNQTKSSWPTVRPCLYVLFRTSRQCLRPPILVTMLAYVLYTRQSSIHLLYGGSAYRSGSVIHTREVLFFIVNVYALEKCRKTEDGRENGAGPN